MSVPASATGDHLNWAPEACTLPTAERPLRLADFDDLFVTSLHAVERAPGQATTSTRLILTGDKDLRDRVQRMADAESSCCSFFTFTVSTPQHVAVTPPEAEAGRVAVALDIEVPPQYADVLDALVCRAEGARQGAPSS
jgi:hypothetical protein